MRNLSDQAHPDPLGMSAPITFIATKNPALSQKFYAETLGLKLVEDNPFAIVFDNHGIMLRVQKVQQLAPAQHTVLGWQVPDITAAVKDLTKKGAHFERFPGLPQNDLSIWTSPAGAQIAWFKDPDGNVLSLTQF